jgi:hypothetical protein
MSQNPIFERHRADAASRALEPARRTGRQVNGSERPPATIIPPQPPLAAPGFAIANYACAESMANRSG